jgi:HAE1 family hydrophobic/amphiphilic exporter-1
MESGPLMVNHTNALPSVTISFDVKSGVPLSEGVNAIKQASDEILPKSVNREMIGTAQIFESSFAQMGALMIVAIIAVYLILGILYENFVHPLTALSAIPVAALGALITLFVLGQSLSIYAFVGILMLLGIVMKNGILIIEFSLELMETKGMTSTEAVKQACMIRFRPILMTTLAATMGAIPVAIGFGGTEAKGRAPLGQVIVGGLIFSQIVTLFITPVVFVLVCKMQDYFTSRFEIFKKKKEEEETPL